MSCLPFQSIFLDVLHLICHLTSHKWFCCSCKYPLTMLLQSILSCMRLIYSDSTFSQIPPPCCSTLKIKAVPAWLFLAIHEEIGMIYFHFQCLRMILEPAGLITPVPLLLHPEHIRRGSDIIFFLSTLLMNNMTFSHDSVLFHTHTCVSAFAVTFRSVPNTLARNHFFW